MWLDTGTTWTEQEWRKVIQGKTEQMHALDEQPQRLRELVREHGLSKAIEMYRAELIRDNPKCQHGRFPTSCPHCVWANRGK